MEMTDYLEKAKQHTIQANEAAKRREAWSMALKWLGALRTLYSDTPTHERIDSIWEQFRAAATSQCKALAQFEAKQREKASQCMALWENS